LTIAIRCSTYQQLMVTLDARRRQLSMTMIDLDDASGLQDGYSAKLICGMKSLGKVSTPLLLEALGVELLVVLPSAGPVEKTLSAGSAGLFEKRALPPTGDC
jgi:hypothetical protein